MQPLLVAALVYAVPTRAGPWAIGVTASLKPLTLLLLGVHAWRRDWRSVGIGLGVAAVLWLPILFFGLASYPFGSRAPEPVRRHAPAGRPGLIAGARERAPTHSRPLRDPPSCPCRLIAGRWPSASWSPPSWLVQVLVPVVALFGPRPGRFAWQMYSALPDVPRAWTVAADGSEQPVDLDALFAVQRAEIDYAAVLRTGLCDADRCAGGQDPGRRRDEPELIACR